MSTTATATYQSRRYEHLSSGQRRSIYRTLLPHLGTEEFPRLVTELIWKYGVKGSTIMMIWFEHHARARTAGS